MAKKLKVKIVLTSTINKTINVSDYRDDEDFEECFDEDGDLSDEGRFIELLKESYEDGDHGDLVDDGDIDITVEKAT